MALRRKESADPLVATETWFLKHGMPWFVPAERARARAALAPRRFVPLAVAAGLVGLGVGVGLAYLSGTVAVAPALLLTLAVAGFVAYLLTAMRARPILTYALARTGASLPRLLPMATRALPLLLVFMTFLFINAEVWQMSASLDAASLWITVLLFTVLGLAFFLVRLPEEIDRADDDLDDARVVQVCRGTPMEHEVQQLARQPGVLAEESHVIRYERVNLTLVLLITQLVQVLLMSLTIFGFFLVFGLVTMREETVEAWVGGDMHNVSWLPSLSAELVQVSTFLAAFAGLYFTVFSLTDEVYRREFFTGVVAELEQAIGVRAAYVAACRVRGHDIEVEVDAEVDRRRESGPSARPVPVDPDDQPTQPVALDDQPTRQLPLE